MTPEQRMKAAMQLDGGFWVVLRELADNDHVGEFYATYARYLEQSNVASGRREILVRMAKRAAELLGSKL